MSLWAFLRKYYYFYLKNTPKNDPPFGCLFWWILGGPFGGVILGYFFPCGTPQGPRGAKKVEKTRGFFDFFGGPGPGASKRLKNREVLLGPILGAILGGILGAILGGSLGRHIFKDFGARAARGKK